MIILGNIVSFIACIMMLLSGYVKKGTIIYQTLQLLIMSISYAILGAWGGIVTNLIAIIRNLLLTYNKLSFSAKCGISITTILAILIHPSKEDILAIASVVPYTMLLNNDEKRIKLLILFTTIPWVIYGFIIQNYVVCIFNTLTIIMCAIGYYRIKNTKGES